MIQVTQLYTQGATRTDGHTDDGTPGDCYRAALASLLDLPAATVPHFGLYLSWWDETRRWLQLRELDLAYLPADDERLEDFESDVPLMVGGRSPRGDFGHVVVGTIGGETLWDPHPSRAGLRNVEEFFILVRPYGHLPERLALC